MNYLDLKKKLINTLSCEENEYLDLYVQLILENRDNTKIKYENQKHHIIPKFYFRTNNLPIDNSQENVVFLSHYNHCLAHYYLYHCTSGTYKSANAYACHFLFGDKHFPETIEEFKLKFADYDKLCTTYNKASSIRMQGHAVSEAARKHLAECARNRQLGTKLSQETKEKISKANKGKTMSRQSRIKMSLSHSDVNGEGNPAFGRHWYNNGVDRLYLKDTDDIPKGFVRGNLPLTDEDKKRKSESNKGKHGQSKGSHWYNNGTISIMSKTCPDGFIPGRLKVNTTKKQIGSKNKIWITNGTITKYIPKDSPIPDGFIKGRKYKIN